MSPAIRRLIKLVAIYFLLNLNIQLAASIKHSNILKGKHLRIASMDLRPYMFIDHDDNGNISQIKGFVYEIILWLSERYDFTFTLLEPNDHLFGSLVNKSWNGMIRMSVDYEVDLIAAPIAPSRDRTKVLDFTTTFSEDPAACLIPGPKETGKLAAIVQPFHYEPWIYIITSIFFISVVTWITMRFTYKTKDANYYVQQGELRNHIYSTFGVMCTQHQKLAASAAPHSTRIALSVWCLISVVLVCFYTSTLISFLTVPKLKPVVGSIEELANQTRLQVTVSKSSIFETLFLEAVSGPFKVFGDYLKKNPDNRMVSKPGQLAAQKVLEKVLDGRSAVIGVRAQLEQAISLDYELNKQCRLSLMPRPFLPPLRSCFALPKGSPYTKIFDEGIMQMQEIGLLELWKRRFMSKTDLGVRRCQSILQNKVTEPEKQSERTPLSLESVCGTFLLLLIGYIVATTAFVFERLMSISFKTKNKVDTKIKSEQIALVVVNLEEDKVENGQEPQNELDKVQRKETVLCSSEVSPTANDTVKYSQDDIIVHSLVSDAIIDAQCDIIVHMQEVPEQKEVDKSTATISKIPPKTYYTKESLDKFVVLSEEVGVKKAEQKEVEAITVANDVTNKTPSKPFYTQDSLEIITLDK